MYGTMATRTVESIEAELKKRVPKNDPFAWFIFNQLPEIERIDIMEKCRNTAVYVDRLGLTGAFEVIFRVSLFVALDAEKPWKKHDLRKRAADIGKRDKYYANGGSANGK